ncbi:hypothetical protein FDW83_17195 [Pseudarthrobacter sp. NamE2]|uniref:hypothetical protein n=1 Tax=Pseudarthrobacter sp. NamE2 TaxID=2576838 RepID=UPI0010FEF0BE|nr:hypothetical protein [Pseudarthrobacter sp. NamE2]TLM81226.1 hypothetical protein FDW83_17195 [Pseudarthrobacter sp. NamE2]
MSHMGSSGKVAVVAGIVAAGLLVLTGMTLAMPVFVAFAGVLALACLSALAEVLVRGRRAVLLATGAGTSLTLGCTLAFVGTWELSFDGQSSFLGTPLPTDDPDHYFIGAAASAAGTLLVLFAGAAWPAGKPLAARRRRTAAKRRPAAPRPVTKAAPARRTSGSRAPSGLPAAAKRSSSSAVTARKPAAKPGMAPRR